VSTGEAGREEEGEVPDMDPDMVQDLVTDRDMVLGKDLVMDMDKD